MKKSYFFLLFFFTSLAASAQLVIDNSISAKTPQQLVEDVLIGNNIIVSNVTFNGGTAAVYSDQAGHFTNGNTTNIGFSSGMILATGKTSLAIGPNNNIQAEAAPDNPVQGDPDLALITTNLVRNKCVVEFDFVPQGNLLSFQYVFASEEYPEYNDDPMFNDAFGFFLSGPGIAGGQGFTNDAINIALIPSTNIPVNIANVNSDDNNSYYVANGTGPGTSIQYDGFTTVLTAKANVSCGVSYHIKLAIANVGDTSYDSAVFFRAQSFMSPSVELGVDLVDEFAPCPQQTVTLNTGLALEVPHTWKSGDDVIEGATGPTLIVTESGTYHVVALPFGPACPVSDVIVVGFAADMPLQQAKDLVLCPGISDVPPYEFNLTSNYNNILGDLNPLNYEITFHETEEDAKGFGFYPLPDDETTSYESAGNGETIHVRIVDIATGNNCIGYRSFKLTAYPAIDVQSVADLQQCSGIFNLTLTATDALDNPENYVITYHTGMPSTPSQFLIGDSEVFEGIDGQQIWMYITNVEDTNRECPWLTSFHLDVPGIPVVNAPQDETACSFYILPTPVEGNYYSEPGGTGSLFAAGSHITETKTIYLYSTNGVCSAQDEFTITILAGPPLTVPGDETTCGSYFLPAISHGGYYNQPNGSGTLLPVGHEIMETTTIYVYAISGTHPDTCISQDHFTITILETPEIENPLSLESCDADGNGYAVFDLDEFKDNVTSQPGMTVAYYYDETTLAAGTPLPLQYENNISPIQTIIAVVTNPVNGCTARTSVTLTTGTAPAINVPSGPLSACDEDKNGSALFNLDALLPGITGGNPMTVSFHASQINAINGVSPLSAPYDRPSGTVWIRAVEIPAGCPAVASLELQVNEVPALGVGGNIPDYVLCTPGSTAPGTFDLSVHSQRVLSAGLNDADYNFRYYDNHADALAASPGTELPNSFPAITSPQLIYVRVTNPDSGCYSIDSFSLVSDSGSAAYPIPFGNPLITVCGDDSSGSTSDFNLSALDEIVLGPAQTADGNFTVHYYEDITSAESDASQGVLTANPLAITTPDSFISGTAVIYALVINRSSDTGCPATVAIPLGVLPAPELILQGGFYCVDPITLNPLITYTLTADMINAEPSYLFSFQWFRDGLPLSHSGTTLEVWEQGSYSVIATRLSSGCAFGPVDANVSATSPPVILEIEVSDAFAANATVTVHLDPVSLGIYEFMLDDGPWQSGNQFHNVSGGRHLVYIRDTNNGGCAEIAPVEIRVIDYPKFFTPNNDSYNDYWNIPGLANLQGVIEIFDRYGKLVEQVGPGDQGWDGLLNGYPLPATDYWFKIEYKENNIMKVFRSHFALKR